MINDTSASVTDAVTRLDRDIAETEQRLANLRAMREGIQPFIEQYLRISATLSGPAESRGGPAEAQGAASITDEVTRVFHQHPDEVFELEDVVRVLRSWGSESSPIQIRNAINYVVRMHRVNKGPRRGTYTLRDTSAPAATGADVGEEPNVEGSSVERGEGRDDTSTPPHDQDHGAY
jgi:hypothetical protein